MLFQNEEYDDLQISFYDKILQYLILDEMLMNIILLGRGGR